MPDGFTPPAAYFLQYWTQDNTLKRKGSITSGVVNNPQPQTFNVSNEWDSLPVNTYSNLGTHSCLCGDCIIQLTNIEINGQLFICNQGDSTEINVSITGLPPNTEFDYLWGNGDTSSVVMLTAGDYSVTVTQVGQCSVTRLFTINPPLQVNAFSTPTTKCSGACNGSILLEISGGNPPYTILWDSLAGNSNSENLFNLCKSEYSCIVTDSENCIKQSQAVITAISTFSEEAQIKNIAFADANELTSEINQYYQYSLPNNISLNPSNPYNLLDIGKYSRFKLLARNQKNNQTSIVSGSARIRTNNSAVFISDSTSSLNNIGYLENVWTNDEFEIFINSNIATQEIYFDFIIVENNNTYESTCIKIPISPFAFSNFNTSFIDDDNNPDSQGNDNDIVNSDEIIEFFPKINNISSFNAKYVRGDLMNLTNLPFVDIWNNVSGINSQIFNSLWWNRPLNQPLPVLPGASNVSPEFDYVFSCNQNNTASIFNLDLVFKAGFDIFSNNELSLLKWSLPYEFMSEISLINSNKNFNFNQIEIFPNPTKNYLNIISPIENNLSFNIYNLTGELIKNIAPNNSNTIDISDLKKGFYFIEIKNNTGSIVKKIIKN
jgi:hypothetical protein